ncbi:MAG: DUF4097 domain-containing protein [bacterium]
MRSQFSTFVVCPFFFIALFLSSSHTPSFGQEIIRKGRYFVVKINKAFTVKEGGTLRIYDIRGEVRIKTWDKNEVVVNEIKRMDVYTREEAETVLRKSKASYIQQGEVIEIGGEHYSHDWIKSTFTVTVPKNFNVDIQTSGGDLEVTDLAGDVEFQTTGGDILLSGIDGLVDAKTSGGDVTVFNTTKRVSVKTFGGDLTLEKIGGPLTGKTSGGDISLRSSEDRLDLHTSGGDIDIQDAGGEVRAHTSGGDIDVVNTRGSVEVHTSGGDIDLRSIGGFLEASTSGGDIDGRGIKGRAEVSTSGGSIRLEEVEGGVRAKTSGGDVTVEITLTDFKMSHRVDLRSSGGEIKLTIPEKLPATIEAEIEISDRWEDYNIYSDFPLTSKEEPKREGRRRRRGRKFIRSQGDINGGGDLIELFTANGNIYIKKLQK